MTSEVRAGSSRSEQSATYELRRLLDERGVLHGYVEPDCVWWEGEGNGVAYEAIEVYVLDEPSGYFAVRDLTPQQAIDATLGRGTCEVECFDDGMDEGMDGHWFSYAPPTWYLSCGHKAYGQRPSYCPVCGRKVVE